MKQTLVLILTVLALAACATNPATGRTELNFFTEEQEIAIGKEAHDEILTEYDVYDEKPELNGLVDRIGQRIAAGSPRPNLPWTFTLLDTPMVNAMALPGGYIYVTRGILERMNSEDELAGVIGHEVAHVAARHSTASMSKGTLAQIGIVTAAVLAGEENTERYGALVLIGAGLLFTKYSRGQETQADLLGTAYMCRSGYNPHGSEQMLHALQRLEGGRVSGIERYFMDHPDPRKRADDVRREIATLEAEDPAVVQRNVDRAAFVRKLDGIVTGNNTRDTIVEDGVVYNRTYGLVARAPRGWRALPESGSLFALYPTTETQEVIYAQELTAEELADHDDPRDAVHEQLREIGLELVDSENGIDRWRGDSDGTTVHVHSAQRRADDGAVAFLHLSAAESDAAALRGVLRSLRIGDERARRMSPPRLRVQRSSRGDTWSGLAERMTGNPDDAADLAHINGFDYPSEVPAGLLLKLPERIAGD